MTATKPKKKTRKKAAPKPASRSSSSRRKRGAAPKKAPAAAKTKPRPRSPAWLGPIDLKKKSTATHYHGVPIEDLQKKRPKQYTAISLTKHDDGDFYLTAFFLGTRKTHHIDTTGRKGPGSIGAAAAIDAFLKAKGGKSEKKEKSSKKAASSKLAKEVAEKIVKPFPVDACRRLVECHHTRLDAKAKRAKLKKDRKELRLQIGEHEKEIDSTIAAEESDGRDGKKTAFSLDASKKLVGLRADVARWAKTVATLEGQISDLNDQIREANGEISATLEAQDPTGSLFAEHHQTSKE